MPLYQLVCISVHQAEYSHIKKVVTQTAMHVLNAGGVVRQIQSMGTRVLPQRMKRHKAWKQIGDYWTMDFDTSPRTVNTLNGVMRQDPAIIRWTVLKRASRAEDVAKVGSRILSGDERLFSAESREALTVSGNANGWWDSDQTTTNI